MDESINSKEILDSNDLNFFFGRNNNISFLLDSVLSTSAGAVLIVNLNNDIIYINKKFTELWNIPHSSIENIELTSLLNFISPQLANTGDNSDQFIYSELSDFVKEKLLRLKKGKIFKSSYDPLILKEQHLGYIWSLSDVTKRISEEVELLNEKYLLKSLLDNIPDSIYFKDLKSNFTRINKAQAVILGVANPNDAIGKNDFDFFDNDHASSAFEDEQKLMKEKKGLVGKIEKIRYAESGYVWVTATKEPIYNDKGEVVGMVGISRDISKIKENEKKLKDISKELKKLNRTKDRLFSIVAHDLRGPFNALLGLSEILLMDFESLSKEEIKSDLEEIYGVIKTQFQLLENLLNWARIENSNMKFEPETLSLKEKTDFIYTLLTSNLRKKNIQLNCDVTGDVVIYADPNMVVSILLNLVINAIKYTAEGGRIRISAQKEKKYFQVSVEDNGIGMDKDILAGIFEGKYNSTPGTNKEKGTGLGLMICKEMVEMQKGSIWAESKKGLGSTFRFTLPAAT